MKPTLHVAILRATGHGGRTLLQTLDGGARPLRELETRCETETRAYTVSLGMPSGARVDELPVHGALVLVRVADGVEEGTHRALRHAFARGVRHVVIVLNTHGASPADDPDTVERDARAALFDHGFDGDAALATQRFDRATILSLLDEHVPFFELGQELLPRLMHALRLCEHGPQLVDVLDDGWIDGRSFPRMLAALVDHDLVTVDADLFVSLTPAGIDALDDPGLVSTAAAQASRAPFVPFAIGDMYGPRLAARRDLDARTVFRFGDFGPIQLALAGLLRSLPLGTTAQDALAALYAATDEANDTGGWRELADPARLARAFLEVEALAQHTWLFAEHDAAWRALQPLADWLRGTTSRVFILVEPPPVEYDDW